LRRWSSDAHAARFMTAAAVKRAAGRMLTRIYVLIASHVWDIHQIGFGRRAAGNVMSATSIIKSSPPRGHVILAGLGLSESWHVALLLPLSYREPAGRWNNSREVPLGRPVRMTVTVDLPPRSYFNGAPRVVTSLIDGHGETFRASVFGNSATWKELLTAGSRHALTLKFQEYNGDIRAVILGVAAIDEAGDRPVEVVYPSIPGTLAASEVRAAVLEGLDAAIPAAASHITAALETLAAPADVLAHIDAAGWTIEQLLDQVHRPLSLAYGEFAREMLLKLAGLAQLHHLADHHATARAARAFALGTIAARSEQLPFKLTEHQVQAVGQLAAQIRTGEPLRGLLIGDVGSGKTCTFGVLAAATIDAGGRVAILLPSTVLADQVHRELSSYWPDLAIALVTGDSTANEALESERFVIGTSAILHRQAGYFDLVIIDEEQKFSIEQKSQLSRHGAHQLTVTATCIPRTLALARYGALTVVVLPEGHAQRFIETRIRYPVQTDRAELFAAVRHDLRMGQQVLVIYPLRDAQHPDDRHSVHSAREGWAKTFGAERVRTLTGEDSDERKAEVMADMRAGRAQILLATTVVEVGVNLPNLFRVIVVSPDRFGAATLHQLRGRAARKGGEGCFDLLLTGPVSAKTAERLDILVRCRNGFEVAERDMELRGFGDLGVEAIRQTGADESLVFGQACPVAMTDRLVPLLQQLRALPRSSEAQKNV